MAHAEPGGILRFSTISAKQSITCFRFLPTEASTWARAIIRRRTTRRTRSPNRTRQSLPPRSEAAGLRRFAALRFIKFSVGPSAKPRTHLGDAAYEVVVPSLLERARISRIGTRGARLTASMRVRMSEKCDFSGIRCSKPFAILSIATSECVRPMAARWRPVRTLKTTTRFVRCLEGKRMASGHTGNVVPGNRLRVRLPCPPL